MTRPAGCVPPLLVAGLLSACVAREPSRPSGSEVRGVPPAPPAVPVPSESAFFGRNFSLMNPKLELPPSPDPPAQAGAGQDPVPLGTSDPRYAEYFAELKRRIEANWNYPQEASRGGQSGQGLVGFVLRRNGSVREVEIVQSSGVEILDRYLVNAIRLAQPFPPIPASVVEDVLPITFTFTYTLRPRTSL